MAAGHSWGGASRAGSNHPTLTCTSAVPPYPRRGVSAPTYVALYSLQHGPHPSHVPVSELSAVRNQQESLHLGSSFALCSFTEMIYQRRN